MAKLTIDGIEVEVPAGTTVLKAAQQAGIEIPTLCNHHSLEPLGGCRLCVVEVEGMRTLQTSCTLPASDGLVVHTNTPRVHNMRKQVLGLIFSERNHYCMYCQVSGGDCELQNAAYGEGMTHWPFTPTFEKYRVDASHKYFVFEHNRCIMCRRCIRACSELVGNFTLGVYERGAESRVVADMDVPMGESTCVECGTCTQICPTGALIDRNSAYLGLKDKVDHTFSTCSGCSVGCGIEVLSRDDRVLRILGDWNAPVNGGILCRVGRFEPMEEGERVLSPMVRKNGSLKEVSWDEAIKVVVGKLRESGDSVAALASTRLCAETLYEFKQIFGGIIRTDMVTSVEEGVTTAKPGRVAEKMGRSIEVGLSCLRSSDCVFLAGVDLVANHQVSGFFVKRTQPYGTKVIVVDVKEDGMSERADLFLKINPGTDADLFYAMMALMFKAGLVTPPDALAKRLAACDVKGIAKKVGVEVSSIEKAARVVATSDYPVTVYGKGISRGSDDESLVALVEMMELVGAKEGDTPRLISTKGKANSYAAWAYGLDKEFTVKGHKAVYLALGDDEVTERLLEKVKAAPFLVVQATHRSPAVEAADVVLPVSNWAEQEGHMVNLEGRIQKVHAPLKPPTNVRTNQAVLEAIAEGMGVSVSPSRWEDALYERTPIVAVKR